MSGEDVVRIGKKLDKMIKENASDHVTALDLMKTLQTMPMTLDVLQKTRIGMTVNNFRKNTSNDEVISLAKSLIKSWKKLLSSDSQTSSQSSVPSRSNSIKDEDSMDSSDSKQNFTERKNSLDSTTDSTPSENNSSQAFPTNDPVRLKCRELLASALKIGTCDEGTSPEDIAAHIEDCIFNEFRHTDMKYKNRVRSRVANLKDSRNPTLRQNVLNGFIAPERMASMTAEEMASDDLKELRHKLTKEAIDDHQMGKTGGTQTDLLKCGKCLKSNCTYNQLQTRSSDEPMTTFCFCNECGHRWKFC